MSCLTAATVAALRPDLVRGLVLVGGFPTLAAVGKEAFRARAARVATEGLEGIVDAVVGAGLGAYTHQTQPALVGLYRQALLANNPGGYAANCQAVAEADITPLLPHVTCPTAIVLGEQEQVAPLAAAKALKAGIPRAELKVVPRAGHFPFLEQPAVFHAMLLETVGSWE
jgi:3-oxoadipate enol-lactonase